jgi:hypothetical protein
LFFGHNDIKYPEDGVVGNSAATPRTIPSAGPRVAR